MEAELTQSLTGIGRQIHSSEMRYTRNGIRMNRLAILIHSPAIIGARHSFASREAHFYAGDAAHALPLVEIQDITTPDCIVVHRTGLNGEVGGLPAARGAICTKNMHGIILNGKCETIAHLAASRHNNIPGLSTPGNWH